MNKQKQMILSSRIERPSTNPTPTTTNLIKSTINDLKRYSQLTSSGSELLTTLDDDGVGLASSSSPTSSSSPFSVSPTPISPTTASNSSSGKTTTIVTETTTCSSNSSTSSASSWYNQEIDSTTTTTSVAVTSSSSPTTTNTTSKIETTNCCLTIDVDENDNNSNINNSDNSNNNKNNESTATTMTRKTNTNKNQLSASSSLSLSPTNDDDDDDNDEIEDDDEDNLIISAINRTNKLYCCPPPPKLSSSSHHHDHSTNNNTTNSSSRFVLNNCLLYTNNTTTTTTKNFNRLLLPLKNDDKEEEDDDDLDLCHQRCFRITATNNNHNLNTNVNKSNFTSNSNSKNNNLNIEQSTASTASTTTRLNIDLEGRRHNDNDDDISSTTNIDLKSSIQCIEEQFVANNKQLVSLTNRREQQQLNGHSTRSNGNGNSISHQVELERSEHLFTPDSLESIEGENSSSFSDLDELEQQLKPKTSKLNTAANNLDADEFETDEEICQLTKTTITRDAVVVEEEESNQYDSASIILEKIEKINRLQEKINDINSRLQKIEMCDELKGLEEQPVSGRSQHQIHRTQASDISYYINPKYCGDDEDDEEDELNHHHNHHQHQHHHQYHNQLRANSRELNEKFSKEFKRDRRANLGLEEEQRRASLNPTRLEIRRNQENDDDEEEEEDEQNYNQSTTPEANNNPNEELMYDEEEEEEEGEEYEDSDEEDDDDDDEIMKSGYKRAQPVIQLHRKFASTGFLFHRFGGALAPIEEQPEEMLITPSRSETPLSSSSTRSSSSSPHHHNISPPRHHVQIATELPIINVSVKGSTSCFNLQTTQTISSISSCSKKENEPINANLFYNDNDDENNETTTKNDNKMELGNKENRTGETSSMANNSINRKKVPEDNVERLRNIRDMFESSNYSEELTLQKVEKLQPSEKLIARLTNELDLQDMIENSNNTMVSTTTTNSEPDDLINCWGGGGGGGGSKTLESMVVESSSSMMQATASANLADLEVLVNNEATTANADPNNNSKAAMLAEAAVASNQAAPAVTTSEGSSSESVSSSSSMSSPFETIQRPLPSPPPPQQSSDDAPLVDLLDDATGNVVSNDEFRLHADRFEEGGGEEENEEEEEEDESQEKDGIIKNRRVQKKKDVIPFADLNNVKTKFEKIGESSNDVPATPKPVRSITPPPEGVNTGEIENEPMQRPEDVVSVYAKVEDHLPDAGYARSRKELFDSIGTETKTGADGLPRVKSFTPPREEAMRRVLKESTPERNENVVRETDRNDDILPTAGHIKNTAAMFASGRQKSIERSGITLEGELLEKGIAKQRLALFNDPSALNTASHAPSTAELESEYIKNVSGIAKERLNMFKTLEQTGGDRTSPSRELKKLKEFTPPPQLPDHAQRQYIIIDKQSSSSSSASSPSAPGTSKSTSSTSSSSSASPPSSTEPSSPPSAEFVPEHGLAKSRMRQYLETTAASSAHQSHDVVVDELTSKGLAKSLLAKWKSMESVKAETTLLNHIHHNHQSDHNKSAVLIAANLSSRSTANAMTTTPASRRNNQSQSQHRAVSRDRITTAPPVVIVAANSSPSATSTDEISAEEQLPQAGTAKQLLSKWQHNLEAAAATTTTVKRPANDLYKNEDENDGKSKEVFQDEALAAIGKGHAKSALAKFEQSVADASTHVRKSVTPPKEYIKAAGSAVKTVFESQPLESNVNAQFIEEEIIPQAGSAKSLKDKFLTLEKEASKVETASSKMTYVPKKFTAPSAPDASQKQQQQKPKPKPAQQQQQSNGLLTTAAAQNNNAQNGAQTTGEKCCVCEKTVYAMEKIEADKKVYHKTCFKCTSCNCPLKLGNFSSIKQTLYCTPHYIQLFARNGNYDEGFGLENYKRKWLPQQQQTSTRSSNGALNAETSNSTSALATAGIVN